MQPPAASVEIEIRNLSKWYGTHQVLKSLSTDVRRSEAVVLIGPSGSGKTTFLRCINLLEQFQEGEIRIGGESMGYQTDATGRRRRRSERDIARLRAKVGMVFQSFNLFPHMSVLQNVTIAPVKVLGLTKELAEERGIALLKRIGLDDKAKEYPDRLSGGQQQRVAIARVMIGLPDLIIADEPTSALDRVAGRLVVDQLKDLAMRAKCAVVLSTHDERIFDVASRRLHIEDGRCFEVPIHYH